MLAGTLAAYDGSVLDLTGLRHDDRHSYRAVAAGGWISAHGTQLCPACLAESGRWRTAWRLPTVTVCPDHHSYLLARCPACQRPFRDQRHSPLRRIGASTDCGNPLGDGPTRQCRHDLTTLTAEPADPGCLQRQHSHDQAVTTGQATMLGQTCTAQGVPRHRAPPDRPAAPPR